MIDWYLTQSLAICRLYRGENKIMKYEKIHLQRKQYKDGCH
jgi:hypothetical protein